MGHYALSARITFGPLQGAEDDPQVPIFFDGDHVGTIYKQIDDPSKHLRPEPPFYLIHLSEDGRGWKRVTDRSQLRGAVEQRIRTHSLYKWDV